MKCLPLLSGLTLLSLFTSGAALADKIPESVKGCFYVSVDNTAVVFVNGKQIHRGGLGVSRSAELELKVGDRVVMQVENLGGPKKFQTVFLSTDKQKVINFRRSDWRLVQGGDVKDFDAEQYRSWTKAPTISKEANAFSFKHQSDPVWGDKPRFTIACNVSASMLSNMSK
jgi:hypothetical protein